MAKPVVIVVGADKGGVGKTTVSRTLLDYFSANNVATRAFDTESPRGTLKRFHPEITEIVDRVSKIGSHAASTVGAAPTHAQYAAGGPALLFENIKGHPGQQVLINQFGSERRMALSLGVDKLDEIANRITALMQMKAPGGGLFDKLKMLPQLAELGNVFPKTVSAKDAPCKEVILREGFDLNAFPILKCWPHDGGRFITLPCVHTRDPKTGRRNVGMYRMQVYDGQTTGMHWQRQKVAAEHYREALRNEPISRIRMNPEKMPQFEEHD